MKKTITITFRVPTEVVRLGIEKSKISGCKSVGIFARNLFIENLKGEQEKPSVQESRMTTEDKLLILSSFDNLREFMKRSFKILLEIGNLTDDFEKRTSKLNEIWDELVETQLKDSITD